MPRRSAEQARSELTARLRSRRAEIEEAILTRILTVSGPLGELDPEYEQGLRGAVAIALEHGLDALDLGEEPPTPPPLLSQARLAARNGIRLDTVCRRYVAGHALLVDFLVEEAKASGLGTGSLQGLLRAQAGLLDRLLNAVGAEHAREAARRLHPNEQRDAERIERLLAGELPDTSQFAYDLKAHHTALIAKGPGIAEAIRELAADLDRRLLLLQREDGSLWAWLGGRDPIETLELQDSVLPSSASVALGEPAKGLGGWRLSHRQAKAAMPIALRGRRRVVRYAEVALLAAVLQDELFSVSLRALFLDPLERERDGGKAARETLRAYFATERNVSSAAALLGVKRHTVTNRLRIIEQHLGQSLRTCSAEIEAALQVEELDLR
jgi:PucR C-terminal helix-turn-helix domain/GGDEF-like domain